MKSFIDKLVFDQNGLIPAIIQDDATKKVLTLCYMNKEALELTLKEKKIYLFRRSQGKLMMKGQTSGHIQIVKGVYPDCENKSLLFLVDQKVAACHKGYFSCYFAQADDNGSTTVRGTKVFEPNATYKKG